MSKRKIAAVVPAVFTNPVQKIRIIKIGICKSLSGKSILTYHVGHATSGSEVESDTEASALSIQFRVHANSSAGFFSQEWVKMSDIQQVFDKASAGQPITSYMLHPLFRGKSINSSGFLLAVLQHAGFVRHMIDKKRNYERIEPTEFMAEMVTLIEAGTDLKSDAKPAPVKSASKKSQTPALAVDASPESPSDASPEQAGN